jgi:hypothetical protein
MANRHAGGLADIFKHLVLAEAICETRPRLYAETHAGNATYPVEVPVVAAAPHRRPLDPAAERIYGAARFQDAMEADPTLASSTYGEVLSSLVADLGVLPGSPAIAMAELGAHATYLLCDLDSDSTANIARHAMMTGLGERVATVTADGMQAVARRVLRGAADPATTFVHVDPYDPWAVGPGGLSAVDVARALVIEGVTVMYWYGYDRPAQRAWALAELSGHAPLWCVDLMVTGADGGVRADGRLGRATTPGTGSGAVVAHVGGAALERCRVLGEALSAAYRGVPLPSGEPGAVALSVATA